MHRKCSKKQINQKVNDVLNKCGNQWVFSCRFRYSRGWNVMLLECIDIGPSIAPLGSTLQKPFVHCEMPVVSSCNWGRLLSWPRSPLYPYFLLSRVAKLSNQHHFSWPPWPILSTVNSDVTSDYPDLRLPAVLPGELMPSGNRMK